MKYYRQQNGIVKIKALQNAAEIKEETESNKSGVMHKTHLTGRFLIILSPRS